METYSFAREFADTWGLLALVGIFLAVVIWVLRPGSSEAYRDSAQIPLRNDKPASDEDAGDKKANREAHQ